MAFASRRTTWFQRCCAPSTSPATPTSCPRGHADEWAAWFPAHPCTADCRFRFGRPGRHFQFGFAIPVCRDRPGRLATAPGGRVSVCVASPSLVKFSRCRRTSAVCGLCPSRCGQSPPASMYPPASANGAFAAAHRSLWKPGLCSRRARFAYPACWQPPLPAMSSGCPAGQRKL